VENPAVVGVTAVLGETFELDETGEVLIPRIRCERVYLFFISEIRLTAHVTPCNVASCNRRAAALFNIPVRSEAGRKIRKAFVPRKCKTSNLKFEILSCDYSQIELRVMAALSQDATMIEAFQNNADIHTITAAKVFVVEPENVTSDMRRTAKMVNFGIIYGISAFGLSQRLAIPRAEAADTIEAYFREYPAIRQFMDRTVNEAREVGYVETLSGRRRYFPDLNSSNQNLRGIAERAAINMPIQGTAADMIKLAMIRIAALLRENSYQSKMLLQVHDELIFDLVTDEREELVPLILTAMKTALLLPNGVPIEVSSGTGPNWLAAH
jgi:DNA polymerase I